MRIARVWSFAVICWCFNLASVAAPNTQQPPSNETGTAKQLFDVYDFQIDGNSVLDDETMERAVYAFLGPDKSIDDVEKARAALEDAYRKAGYQTVIVAIPEQDVAEGRVRMEVTEGIVETVHVMGSRYYSLGKIRAALPALTNGQVPHIPSLQDQLSNLGQQAADRNVTPIFRAGSTPGKMDVELRVKDKLPLHGSVEMNSRNTSNTSYSRLIGSVHYDNLWQKFHSLTLQYQVSPELSDEVNVWSTTYAMPTRWADTRLAMYYINISSNTQVPVLDSSVASSGAIYGARLLKPLTGSNVLQSLSLGFDYKDFSPTTTQKLPIAYAVFMTGYDASWRNDWAASILNLALHLALRGVGNDAAQFAARRLNAANQGASPDFLYLTAAFKNLLSLPGDVQMLSRIQGQASSTFLLNYEQFAAGGPLSVRGYHQSQVLGDNGLNLSLELHSPKLFSRDWEAVKNFRVIAFAEWAGLWSNNQLPTPSYNALASAGLGLRMKLFKYLSGELDWAYPLQAYNSLIANVNVGQQRVDFRMVYEF